MTTTDICMRIFGGLGNQMFQYAAGYALARRLGVGLLLHPVGSRPAHARFVLDRFGRPLRLWKPDPAAFGLLDRLRGKTKGKRAIKAWRGPIYKQKHLVSTEGLADIAPATYFIGYFQSEQFFEDYKEEIRAFFDIARFVEGVAPELSAPAQEPGAVSLHIRRGDYAADPQTRAARGLLEEDHYNRARSRIEDLVNVRRWLVFSDDPEAAAALTAGWPGRTIVTGNSAIQDMALMSACSHHIIANSSFSWWGAWLGQKPGQVVIAPRAWFSEAEMQRRDGIENLIPPGWISI
jgi:hypothetical protein